MVRLIKHKYQNAIKAFEMLKDTDINKTYIQHKELLKEIEWLLRNAKKYSTNPAAFEKKMISIKNAIQVKLVQCQESGVVI